MTICYFADLLEDSSGVVLSVTDFCLVQAGARKTKLGQRKPSWGECGQGNPGFCCESKKMKNKYSFPWLWLGDGRSVAEASTSPKKSRHSASVTAVPMAGAAAWQLMEKRIPVPVSQIVEQAVVAVWKVIDEK